MTPRFCQWFFSSETRPPRHTGSAVAAFEWDYTEVMDWSCCQAVDRNPAKVGGVWCFRGTRLPVASLFEHLDRGSTVDEFIEWFPGVRPELIHEVLAFAANTLDQPTAAA